MRALVDATLPLFLCPFLAPAPARLRLVIPNASGPGAPALHVKVELFEIAAGRRGAATSASMATTFSTQAAPAPKQHQPGQAPPVSCLLHGPPSPCSLPTLPGTHMVDVQKTKGNIGKQGCVRRAWAPVLL